MRKIVESLLRSLGILARVNGIESKRWYYKEDVCGSCVKYIDADGLKSRA